jgi:lipid II:glycine glycyltransferase (peptidoglycan interpeptide bridge formation enzyme)
MFYKGDKLVAIYPIFIQKQGIIKLAFSPPIRSYMLFLGPVIADYDSLKQSKKEIIYFEIQQELDKYIFETKGCKYARIRSSPGLYDSRPLIWAGYDVEPNYTYRINLSKGIDYVWENLDRKVRQFGINKAIKEGVTVRSGDWDDIEYIHRSLYNRFVEQGIKPNDNIKYLRTLYENFYPNNLKIFIAEYKGERCGGEIVLCYKEVVYSWVGAPKSPLVGISPNDLVHWEAIKWAFEHDFKIFDMMDIGHDPRLIPFKVKYNPDLAVWYSATKYSSFVYKMVENIFHMVRK